MAEHDSAFAKLAIHNKLLTADQQKIGSEIITLLQKHGIAKSLAQIAQEAEWMKPNAVAAVIGKVKNHPPLKPPAAVVDKVHPAQRAGLEKLSMDLASLGYTRSPEELAGEKPMAKPSAGTAARQPAGTRVANTRTRGPGGAPPPANKAGSKTGLIVGIAAGAVVIIGAVVFMMTRGGTPSDPSTAKSNDTKQPPGGTTAKPPPPTTQAPPPLTPEQQRAKDDEDMRMAAEENKKKVAAEREKQAEKHYADGKQFIADQKWKEAFGTFQQLGGLSYTEFYKTRKAEIEELTASARDKRFMGSGPKPPDTTKTPVGPDPVLKAEFDKRRAAHTADGKKRLDAAKGAIAAERAAEKKRLADIVTKIGGQKFSLKIRAGQLLGNAQILEIARDDLKVLCDSGQTSVTWDMLDDPSFASVSRAIHKDTGAQGQYELGRKFVARKMWKDAKAAFDGAVKLDDTFKDRVPDLTPILSNQAAFKGVSRRLGRDVLSLTYDFSTPEQAQDFDGPRPATVDQGLVLEMKTRGMWSIKDVEYDGEVLIETAITCDGDASPAFTLLWSNIDRGGYVLALGGEKGFELIKHTGEKKDTVAEKAGEKVPAGAQLRIAVKAGDFKVFVDGKEVFSATDATFKKGWCAIGVLKGKATYAKLAVTGKVNPVEIDKRFAESEVLVRRALEGDLNAKREKREVKDVVISAEDEFFMKMLTDEQKAEYATAKEKALKIMQVGRTMEDYFSGTTATLFSGLISAAPDFVAAQYWKAMLDLDGGNSTPARRDLLRTLRRYPDFYEALAAIGQTWEDDQDYDKAQYYAGEALKRMPDYAPALALQGYLKFVIQADARAAMEDLELALKIDPSHDTTRTQQKSIANVVKGPEHLGCKFKKEFPHFWVMTDISAERTQLYGERLEAAYKHFAETFKQFYKEDPKRPKPRVAIFNTREAYMTYSELTLSSRQEFTLGYFIAAYRELLLFEDVDLDETLQTLYHESFHNFMSTMMPRPPYWYNEGIAEYMGGLTIDKGKIVEKARLLTGRLKGLKRDLKHALDFDDIIKQTPGEFYSGPVSFKYAQAWSMIHFFYEHEKGKHRALLDSYYKLLVEGKENEDAFDETFGKADLAALKKEWSGYVEKLEVAEKKETPKK